MRRLWKAVSSSVLLTGFMLAATAVANSSFDVRITITSECGTQRALFGPNAQRPANVSCQPAVTPYQTYTINLDTDYEQQAQADTGGTRAHANIYGTTAFKPFKKEALFPPLLHKSASASKVFYVIF